MRDLNDQTPKFRDAFLYLNASENMGEEEAPMLTSSQITNECKLSLSSTMADDLSNLIPIERAFDMDAKGANSQIAFAMYMFKNVSAYFVPQIELEKNEIKRDLMVKSAMNTQIAKCDDLFEIVDNEDMLFLKINAHLDREKQDVYNFILIASDANNFEDFSKVSRKS